MPRFAGETYFVIMLPLYVYLLWRLLAWKVPILAQCWKKTPYNEHSDVEDCIVHANEMISTIGLCALLPLVYSMPLWGPAWVHLRYGTPYPVYGALGNFAIRCAVITGLLALIISIFAPFFVPDIAMRAFKKKEKDSRSH